MYLSSTEAPPRIIASWDVCRVAVGGLLFIASLLKVNGLLTATPRFSTDWLASPQVQWILVGYESALAVWLFSGIEGRLSRWMTGVTFGLFAIVSFAQAVANKPTCSCFGAVHVQPLGVFVVDALIVVWVFLTTRQTKLRPAIAPSFRYAVHSVAVMCLLTGLSAATWQTSSAPILSTSDVPREPVQVIQGGQCSVAFRIHNPTDSTVSIARFSTSCDCLKVGLSTWTLKPSESGDGLAVVDLKHRPEFTGELSIDAAAVAGDSRTRLALMTFSVNVRQHSNGAQQ